MFLIIPMKKIGLYCLIEIMNNTNYCLLFMYYSYSITYIAV